MGSFTNYFEGKVLDLVTGKATYALPTAGAIWLALFTAMSDGEAGTGTEVTGGSYARKQTAAADWNAAGTDGTTENATVITFVTPTASWGTVTHFAIMDASTAGNMLAWDDLTTSQAIGTGNTVSFAIGALVLTLD